MSQFKHATLRISIINHLFCPVCTCTLCNHPSYLNPLPQYHLTPPHPNYTKALVLAHPIPFPFNQKKENIHTKPIETSKPHPNDL